MLRAPDSTIISAGSKWNHVAPPLRIVVLDGTDHRVLDDLLAAGRLPVLAEFRNRGAKVEADTIGGVFEEGVWPTVFSGVGLGTHGSSISLGSTPVTTVSCSDANRRISSHSGCTFPSGGQACWPWMSLRSTPIPTRCRGDLLLVGVVVTTSAGCRAPEVDRRTRPRWRVGVPRVRQTPDAC